MKNFEVVELCNGNVTALYELGRLPNNEVPKNLKKYEIRCDDFDDITTLEKSVFVNFGGTILVPEWLDVLGSEEYINIKDIGFQGEEMTVEEYLISLSERKLYEKLEVYGVVSSFEEFKKDYEDGTLTLNEGRDSKQYLWYMNNSAVALCEIENCEVELELSGNFEGSELDTKIKELFC